MVGKRGVAFLLPIYFFALLMLVGAIFIYTDFEIGADTPRVGEAPSKVLEAYGKQEAIELYSENAARLAALQAAKVAVDEEFLQLAREEYTRLMKQYPGGGMDLVVEESFEGGVIRFNSQQDVRVPLSFGRAPATIGYGSGVFGYWPFTADDESAPYDLSSDFGKRDVSRGSTTHPGIDLPAVLGTPVRAVDAGEIVVASPEKNFLYLRTESGYTCGYFHIEPDKSKGDVVGGGEVVAHITKDKDYGLHLDLRCYDHRTNLDEEQAIELVGREHVGIDEDPVGDAYIVFANSDRGQSAYIDAYCLFSEGHREQVTDFYNPPNSITGAATAFVEGLSQTCRVYEETGILNPAPSGLSEEFIDSVFAELLGSEGVECVAETGTSYADWSKFGVTDTTYGEYLDRGQLSKEEICSITREDAREFYVNWAIRKPGYDQLPVEISMGVIDAYVNQGSTWTTRAYPQMLADHGYLSQSAVEGYVRNPQQGIAAVVEATNEALADGFDVSDAWADRRIERYTDVYENPDNTYEVDPWESWMRRTEKYRNAEGTTQIAGVSSVRGTGSLQTNPSTEFELPKEVQESMEQRSDLKGILEQYSIFNRRDINEATRTAGFYEDTDFRKQIKDTLAECADQMVNGCSCYVKSSSNTDFEMTPTEIELADEEFPIYTQWIPIDDDAARPEWEFLFERLETTEDGEPRRVQSQLNTLRYSFSSGSSSGLNLRDGFFVRAEHLDPFAYLYLATENTTNMCEQTVLQQYENRETEDRFSVQHPLRG